MSAPVKTYKCNNFGKCPLADKEETIHFDDEDRFHCASNAYTECPVKNPKCREELVEVQPKKGPKLPRPVLIGAPFALVLLVFFLSLGSCGKNTPAAKEAEIATELRKIWPWLSSP
jgi:hypothetical protein